jgi:nucleoside phosphorylase
VGDGSWYRRDDTAPSASIANPTIQRTAHSPGPQQEPMASTTKPVDFVIITALEEEREAVLALLPGVRKLARDGADTHTYYEATLKTQRPDKAIYRVIVTTLAVMGPKRASAKGLAVVQRWSPRYILLVGIAGGLMNEVSLGDVIVAHQIADYTLGKVLDNGQREVRWETYQVDANLLDAAANFPRGWEPLVTQAPPEPTSPRRHLGVVASGGDVIACKDLLDQYRTSWPKLLGVEMEGSATAAALHETIQRTPFLMVRGVSDLADALGNAAMKAKWRTFACSTAAAYAVGLLRDGPVLAVPEDEVAMGEKGTIAPKYHALVWDRLLEEGDHVTVTVTCDHPIDVRLGSRADYRSWRANAGRPRWIASSSGVGKVTLACQIGADDLYAIVIVNPSRTDEVRFKVVGTVAPTQE